jgi:protein-L-isoaspartate(D-aspartate) O-methyltransferase
MKLLRTRWALVWWLTSLAVACAPSSEPTAARPDAPQLTTAVTRATPSPISVATEAAQPIPSPSPGAVDVHTAAREAMVQDGIVSLGITDTLVLEAMRTVPRHEFVPAELVAQAYENHPLPIGHGQTISQPYIVALMTQAAGVKAGDRVLEIGTGSGYQAAVLATLVDHVYSVEIIGALADSARERLARLGYHNVMVRHADGYFGWAEEAPFDAILVTAAPDHIPQPLVQQLKIGGRMIIPVGPVGSYQSLWMTTRISATEVRTQDLGEVRFVPLTREKP